MEDFRNQVIVKEFETQAANSIVAGFMFASAISWMDVTRYVLQKLIKVEKNGFEFYITSAMVTTLVAVLIFLILKKVSPQVVKPSAIYAVTK